LLTGLPREFTELPPKKVEDRVLYLLPDGVLDLALFKHSLSHEHLSEPIPGFGMLVEGLAKLQFRDQSSTNEFLSQRIAGQARFREVNLALPEEDLTTSGRAMDLHASRLRAGREQPKDLGQSEIVERSFEHLKTSSLSGPAAYCHDATDGCGASTAAG
jgi:hypothetical protein